MVKMAGYPYLNGVFLGACVERQGCSLQGTFEESRATPGNMLGGHLIR
jgi:hypothetical protein